ncbi:hypothetical protein E8E14_001283 [Neopestalotiopsis sp. 37M]|nr:hypothetical protein E8E14_001283 [Neopestalotiopsis sp. 37M]
MGSRVSRIESLVQRLTARLDGEQPRTDGSSQNVLNASREVASDAAQTVLACSPPSSSFTHDRALGVSIQGLDPVQSRRPFYEEADERESTPISRSAPPSATDSAALQTVNQRVHNTSKQSHVSYALREAWPNDHDLEIIVNAPHGASALIHGVVDKPFSSFSEHDHPSPREVLQLPPSGSHPVLVAQKLLVLATFLQCVASSSLVGLAGLSTSRINIMTRAVESAVRLVLSDDDLVDSVEGIECIMIHSLYENNAGNLRRAWVILRRATALAQMMGLHQGRGNAPPLLKTVCAETRRRVNPDSLWLRLMQSDHYLSLMLGLSPASVEGGDCGNPATLESCTSMERMERLEAAASSYILRRNATDLGNLDATREIDELLHKAAGCMPAQWWLLPIFGSPVEGDEVQVFRETVRITCQFTHYTLLLHLHLPYVLCSSPDQRYDQNKMTAATAAREVLMRYLTIRGSNPTSFYCRGIDFIAFIACTVLVLVHIDAHCPPAIIQHDHHDSPSRRDGSSIISAFLRHQRLGDRGIMERVLESMDCLIASNADRVASEMGAVIRPLLAIEADAARGRHFYQTRSSLGVKEEENHYECAGKVMGGDLNDDDNAAKPSLHIYIPHTGAIDIERCSCGPPPPGPLDAAVSFSSITDASGEAGPGGSTLHYAHEDGVQPSTMYWTQSPPMDTAAIAEDWTLQGVDMALFENIFHESTMTD